MYQNSMVPNTMIWPHQLMLGGHGDHCVLGVSARTEGWGNGEWNLDFYLPCLWVLLEMGVVPARGEKCMPGVWVVRY